MTRVIGTVSRGLRAPIIKEGDDLPAIVVETLLQASDQANFTIQDRDIMAVTESILARSQGNIVSLDEVAQDVKAKFESDTVGILYPILSRNRYLSILRGVARACKRVVIQLAYPADEQGNQLVTTEELSASSIDPWSDTLSEDEFRSHFPTISHRFTQEDYVKLYRETVESEGAECQIIFSNQVAAILDYTDHVLVSNIHARQKTKRQLEAAGGKKVLTLADINNQPVNGGKGYNDEFGLLGSNLAGDNGLKLFPRHSQEFAEEVQALVKDKTGKTIEVLVYGDGAFKDPVGGIWELADPVVSPGYTKGLEGTPDEVKLKYLADNQFKDLSGDELKDAVLSYIQEHDPVDEAGNNVALGTTPRRYTDLIGSLADLTSGSGDKGTPFIYIQGYFDNLAD
ncbi:coenzyme F420-0:L-glutamate ligase [Hutsoniella sourekii]|uniref:coenzyme F420-0:L-glutamate ligase n=1 Tax=Hutsoniella sourekii TaxID=87650 RepID=UPI00047F0DF5|nr:coenzyme F420-0:L-glutamate ligase [Hutsoniella sourekii]